MSRPGERPRRPARDAVRAAYDAAADDYDRRHGDARSERRFRIIDAPQRQAARGAGRVLELGCGTGRLLAGIDAPVRIGVDISPGMLRHARRRGLAVAIADAHALPFAGASFDAVLAAKGLFRYLDAERAFRECARVLAPGGRLAVHQYAARTWSLRSLASLAGVGAVRPARPVPVDVHEVDDLDELYRPARAAGLRVTATHLWRSVRVPPYALPIPTWLPGRFWSHCTVVFTRPSGPGGASARRGR
jgi:SAM-dependent methyltransferase